MAKRSKSSLQRRKAMKAYIKFLAYQPQNHPKAKRIQKELVQSAPDEIIKLISNAALNAQSGDIALSPQNKHLFRRNKRSFALLTSPSVPLARKRRQLVNQKGGIAFLPAILASVLPSIGGFLVDKILKRNQQ